MTDTKRTMTSKLKLSWLVSHSTHSQGGNWYEWDLIVCRRARVKILFLKALSLLLQRNAVQSRHVPSSAMFHGPHRPLLIFLRDTDMVLYVYQGGVFLSAISLDSDLFLVGARDTEYKTHMNDFTLNRWAQTGLCAAIQSNPSCVPMQYESWPRRWDQELNAIPDALAIREWNGKRFKLCIVYYNWSLDAQRSMQSMSSCQRQKKQWAKTRIKLSCLFRQLNHWSTDWRTPVKLSFANLKWENETFKMKQAYHDNDPLSVSHCY